MQLAASRASRALLARRASVLPVLAPRRPSLAHPRVYAAMAETTTVDQSPQVKVGDKIPQDTEFMVLREGENEPRSVKLGDITRGKRVVLFGLPGAYTSVCSSKHVPQYNEHYDDLKALGVETIACLSVNDPWVMREWAHHLGVSTDKVLMLADGEGFFHKQVGLLQHLPGLGLRARRYSMLCEDGTIQVLNIEEPGGKSYKVSGPEHMARCIKELSNKTGAA